jgi:hypothetical protein
MPEFFDYNPETGIRHETAEEDGMMVVHTMQDVQPIIDRAQKMRTHGMVDKGIKENFWHVADIPPVVIMELQKKGLDIFKGDQQVLAKVYKEIETNYPYLKVTDKKIA